MKKRLLTLTMATVVAISMTGCGTTSKTNDTVKITSESTTAKDVYSLTSLYDEVIDEKGETTFSTEKAISFTVEEGDTNVAFMVSAYGQDTSWLSDYYDQLINTDEEDYSKISYEEDGVKAVILTSKEETEGSYTIGGAAFYPESNAMISAAGTVKDTSNIEEFLKTLFLDINDNMDDIRTYVENKGYAIKEGYTYDRYQLSTDLDDMTLSITDYRTSDTAGEKFEDETETYDYEETVLSGVTTRVYEVSDTTYCYVQKDNHIIKLMINTDSDNNYDELLETVIEKL